jgi:hypothetical protein
VQKRESLLARSRRARAGAKRDFDLFSGGEAARLAVLAHLSSLETHLGSLETSSGHGEGERAAHPIGRPPLNFEDRATKHAQKFALHYGTRPSSRRNRS